ncbi:Peptidase C15 pyroglutamyl peptidase I [Penicillium verhagenii]|uniref:Peptidase C15 pyroglutamyl peptidase I n=1 Tax=Penicillium verhagenii TaxID=1562060 RepID=UPI0025455604|nr:Peptidase C15 pyroglutamyl peptidase I [Penicillium verhagenii]KAJ5935193.1 Peptidase C15 pyroglutamyl peptidase I [Penicillium verhagenii]
MGDYGPSATSTRSTDQPSLVTPPEISVLVTGFGPFKTNLVNASYLIAKSLPDSFTFAPPGSADRRIVVHVHPDPIPVAYSSVREALPIILSDYAAANQGRRPDLVIHIGIASPRLYYSIEYLAHRDDYNITDINGRSGYEDGEKRWKELGLPPILSPGRAFAATKDQKELRALEGSKHGGSYPPNAHFLDTWKANASAGLDLRISHDAGHYLCDFIYYTSMALATQQGQDRNILFFHVPGASEDADIKRGREITLALIKAMVTCWVDETQSA